MTAKKNLKLMKVVDDAWNKQDWDTLGNCYAENVDIYWPDRLEATRGRSEYVNAAKMFVKGFPDARIENDPYKICFGQDDWTCTIALMSGTNKAPMIRPDGTQIPPTNKTYKSYFCTIARWEHSQIVEQWIFYDMANMMQQLGLMPAGSPVSEKPESQKMQTVLS